MLLSVTQQPVVTLYDAKLQLHGLSLSNQAKGGQPYVFFVTMMLIATARAKEHHHIDSHVFCPGFTVDCGAERDAAWGDGSLPATPSASPSHHVSMGGAAVEGGKESLSFVGGQRDDDANFSLGLDFSVGTFAGGLCFRSCLS